MKHELEEIIVQASTKDAEITFLKDELLKAQTEGFCTDFLK